MHGTESRFVIGPSNILFAGVCVCVCVCTFQPRNVTGRGSEGVDVFEEILWETPSVS